MRAVTLVTRRKRFNHKALNDRRGVNANNGATHLCKCSREAGTQGRLRGFSAQQSRTARVARRFAFG
jgi:hypothetical protein